MSRYTFTAKITGRRSLNAAPAPVCVRGELAGECAQADHPADLTMAVLDILHQSGRMPEIADEIAIGLVRHVPPAVGADAVGVAL